MLFCNPIIPGFNPDPSICRVGDDFFLATSSFEYFPGVPIYHSTNLSDWKLIGHALNRRSQLDMGITQPGAGTFAPTLRHWKGIFYMTTVCFNRDIPKGERKGPGQGTRDSLYVYTDNIWSDCWSDPIKVHVQGIDQDLFFDDDGKVYFSWASQVHDPKLRVPGKFNMGSYVSEIDIVSGKLTGPSVLIRASDHGICIAEGPHIFKRNGFYYLITAEGGTELEHQEWIFRSESPMGPYAPAPPGINPVIYNRMHQEVRQTGHMDLVDDRQGNTWAVFLGVRPQYDPKTGEIFASQLGRETFLAKANWTDEGWLVVNGGLPVGLHGVNVADGINWREDFHNAELQLGWYTLRTPIQPCYDLKETPGTITVYPNAYSVTDDGCPAMLLRKQVAFKGIWSTVLDFSPAESDSEAGTTVYWSKYAFACIGIRRSEEGREVVLRWTDYQSDDIKELTSPLKSNHPVKLQIEAQPTSYTFSYTEYDSDALITVATVSSRTLTRNRPFDSTVTGTFFGIYNQSQGGSGIREPARFPYAEFRGSTL